MSQQAAYLAFVSYAKADQERAQQIASSLEERGVKCWIAPRDVRPSRSYGDEIISGIERSRCFILILSEASNKSAFVAREVERAISKSKPIFTVRIDDVTPSPALELFISGTQWIDAFSGKLGSQIDKLANLLKAEEGVEAPIMAEPASPPSRLGDRRRMPWVLGGGGLTVLAALGAFLYFGPWPDKDGTPDANLPLVTTGNVATDPDYQGCEKLSGEAGIAACDRAIATGKFAGNDLANLYYYRGWERAQKGDTDAALADYSQAISVNPQHASGFNARCNIFRAREDYDAALRDCTSAIQIKSDFASAYNNRGATYADKKDFDHAILDYNEAIRLDPNFVVAYSNRGNSYRRKGDTEHAKEDYLKALSLNPDNDTKERAEAGLVALGFSVADKESDPDYQGCNKLSGNAAITACSRAIDSKKFAGNDLAVLYANRSFERVDKDQLDDAMADVEEALRLSPSFEFALSERGLIHYLKKDYEQALKDYNAAIGLDPRAPTLMRRGNVYRAQQDYERAIADYSEAIKIDATLASVFWNRGQAYELKGDVDHAREDYQKALTLNPNDQMKQDIEDALKKLGPAATAASTPADKN